MASSKFSRTASLMGFEVLVNELGGEPSTLLKKAGIAPELMASGDNLIPSEQFIALLEISARELKCDTFGMQLASKQTLAMLGPIGLLVQQCDSLGDALKQLKQFLYIHSQAGLLSIHTEGKWCYVDFEPLVDYQGYSRQLIELSLGVGINCISELAGREIPLHSVYFSFRKPETIAKHQELFKVPMTFSREVSGVSFDRDILAWPLSNEKVRIKQFVAQYVQAIEHKNPLNLEGRIRTFIRQLLPLGQCSLPRIAELLQVDIRMLQRRLQERSLSYQSLLEDERKALAIRYLKESSVPLSHLADLLGYSELSVFSRNFKKWTGMSPTNYMKLHTERLRLR